MQPAAPQESEARARTTADRSHALEARAEALQAALDEARARAGVERLAGMAGVLGTLADVVEIDAGCERGFEAAVEDALGTVVVDGTGRGPRRVAPPARVRPARRGAPDYGLGAARSAPAPLRRDRPPDAELLA